MTDHAEARPIRVAFVVHVMQVAGAEVLVSEIIARLGSAIEPVIFCLDQVGPLGEALRGKGVPVISFDRKPGVDWSVAKRMAREIRTRQVDVIHAHQYTPFFYSSLARLLSRTAARVILTEHGRHYPDIVTWKRRLANRWIFDRLADAITAVCQFSAKALAEKDGFRATRIEIIPNGIDLAKYQGTCDRAALRSERSLAKDRRYVTIVARFHPVKDHATLIRAFRQVADARPDTDLILIGDGQLRPDIEQQVRQLGLGGRVRLTGVRRDVADWLRASDIFVLSSVSEAASITLIEAMACGIPSVVTNVGGNPELVRDGIDGLLVPRGDADRMSAALLSLLGDDEARRRMGEAAAERARSEFNLSHTTSLYGALFRRVLDA